MQYVWTVGRSSQNWSYSTISRSFYRRAPPHCLCIGEAEMVRRTLPRVYNLLFGEVVLTEEVSLARWMVLVKRSGEANASTRLLLLFGEAVLTEEVSLARWTVLVRRSGEANASTRSLWWGGPHRRGVLGALDGIGEEEWRGERFSAFIYLLLGEVVLTKEVLLTRSVVSRFERWPKRGNSLITPSTTPLLHDYNM